MSVKKSFYLNVNPEPWKVPPFYPSRKAGGITVQAGRSEANEAYKEAVREQLGEIDILPEPYRIHFLFWRQRAQYETGKGRTVTKNEVDATNMQKLTEDALQGYVISNDKHVRHVTSEIIEQEVDTKPMVAVFVEGGYEQAQYVKLPEGFDQPDDYQELSRNLKWLRSAIAPVKKSGNEWPPK